MNRVFAQALRLQQRQKEPTGVDTRTPFQKWSDDLKQLTQPRWFFKSVRVHRGKDDAGKPTKPFLTKHTYVKPTADSVVKGKLARKAAKKQRMAELRARQEDES